jgi:ABC-type oligopeptide transport system substrate-binding subunit
MKKHWNKNGVTALALASIVGMMALTGCGGNNKPTKATYTYHDAMTNSPETWDPSNWETNTDSYILNYTTMGFYDFVLNEAKNGYDIIPEMASGEPTDLTDQLTDEEVVKYGLKTNGAE